MTKAQQTFERINALVDGGMTKAEAFTQLAEEYGQPVDSVRGAYYGAKRSTGSGAPSGSSRSRSRKRETTTQDAIASAVATLRGAVDSIEFELEAARERADEATAEYEAMQAAATGRIAEIRAKIAVLDPDADDATPDVSGTSVTPAPSTPSPSRHAASPPQERRSPGRSRPKAGRWHRVLGVERSSPEYPLLTTERPPPHWNYTAAQP